MVSFVEGNTKKFPAAYKVEYRPLEWSKSQLTYLQENCKTRKACEDLARQKKTSPYVIASTTKVTPVVGSWHNLLLSLFGASYNFVRLGGVVILSKVLCRNPPLLCWSRPPSDLKGENIGRENSTSTRCTEGRRKIKFHPT